MIETEHVTILVALDISPAFDAIDQTVLARWVVRRHRILSDLGMLFHRWMIWISTGRKRIVKHRRTQYWDFTMILARPTTLFLVRYSTWRPNFAMRAQVPPVGVNSQTHIAINARSIETLNFTSYIIAVDDWLLHTALALDRNKSLSAVFGPMQRVKSF